MSVRPSVWMSSLRSQHVTRTGAINWTAGVTFRHPGGRLAITGFAEAPIVGGTTVRKTTARLAAAGALTVAALGATSGAAFASNYAPATPTPSVSDVVTPSASPTTSRSTTPAAVADTGDELAYTGADVLPWAAAGTVLVLGGAGMVVASRRKPGRSH